MSRSKKNTISTAKDKCEYANCDILEKKIISRMTKYEKDFDARLKKVSSELKSQRSSIGHEITRFKDMSSKIISSNIDDISALQSMHRADLEKMHCEFSEQEKFDRTELESKLDTKFAALNKYQDELKEKQMSLLEKQQDLQSTFDIKFAEVSKKNDEIELQQRNLKDEQDEFSNSINNFYSNIVAIIGLLVAVFSVIGMNLNVIPNLIGVDGKIILVDVLILNFSLIASLFFMFYLYSKFVKVSERRFSVIDIIAGLILVITGVVIGILI